VPAGCTTRFRGITGSLFRSEDLRKYRPAPDDTAPPEGFLNYSADSGEGNSVFRSDLDNLSSSAKPSSFMLNH